MAFHDKELTVPGTVAVAGRHVKRYHIDQPDRRLEPRVVDAAYAYVPKLLPAPAGATPVPVHIAFTAADRPTVRAFHDAAVAAGAEVLHAPKEWPEYHAGYYGAFVRDPDGNNVEAVCHRPE